MNPATRLLKVPNVARLAAAAACLLLISCGGGGGGASSPPPPAPTVSLSLTPASVTVGQPSSLTWSATNAASCTSSGAWTGAQSTSGSISVSQASGGTYTYSLACSGAGGNATGSVMLTVTGLANNAVSVVVDNGPAGTSGAINLPFVSVTVCRPGTAICQTIDHVLVDTGSFGLRVVSPGVLDPALALPSVTNAGGNPVGECVQFVSGYLWGSVRQADVKIAGETALALPIQVVSDAATAFASIPASCSSAGANIGTVAALGANGILGIGLFNHDCGTPCANAVVPGTYYGCTASCTGTVLPLASQVANPVPRFTTDNNGVVLALPAVAVGGATTLTGALIFGIGTQANNQLGSATVYATNSLGNFTTTYKGTTLTSSFLDSGSNALFFSDTTIPVCSVLTGFYCPPTPLTLSAVNTSANGAATGTVTFTIENVQALGSAVKAASIGGSTTGTGIQGFDFGLPFFFGRSVFGAISGASTPSGPGPYWAY